MKRLSNWLLGEMNPQAIKEQAVKKRYANPLPSFADRLTIVDFNEQEQVFLFADGKSLGSGFELGDIQAEAASSEYLQAVFHKIRDTFASVVPLHAVDPWVMQMFVQDEYCLDPVITHIKTQIPQQFRDSPLTQDYLKRLHDLYNKMTRPEGLFIDPKTGAPYRGRRRRIRVLFYRQLHQTNLPREQILLEHQEVISQIETKLRSPGLEIKRLKGQDYYQWWIRWFNPKSADEILEQYPYPNPIPAGFNLAQNVFFTPPVSDEDGFVFEGNKQRILYVDGLKEAPIIGLVSRERQQANPKHRYALLDTLPEGSIYTIQVVFSHDENLDSHLTRLEKGIVGTSLKPQEVRDDIRTARNELSMGNRLFWVNQAIFYQAEDEQQAQIIEKNLHAIFNDAKMPLIHSNYDLHPLNSWLNALPFNFDPHYARKYLCFDRLMYATELAALLPVYGRNQGARHLPCFPFFNRLGEPVFFDLLHHDFVSQNSHCAIFANSGGGKSVLTGWMIQSLLAMKNARIVLFEMGNSFDRILIHAKAHGKKTKQLLLSNKKDEAVPLNPFCEAYKAIPEITDNLSTKQATLIAQKIMELKSNLQEPANSEDVVCGDGHRSYLAELALALRTMITEANALEEEQFTLADETLLIEVLSDAILTSFNNDIPQMLTEHIVSAFKRRLDRETVARKKDRILDMHDRLNSYVINSAKSRFFNVSTEPLGDFDIFHVDISAIKDDTGKLALVMVSLLPRILAMAEATQNDNRPTFLFIDESHLQFQIPSVVTVCLLIAKVARKLGLWLVAITQNVTDMNSEKATKILSLIETWILLGLDEKEITDVKRFKSLTPQQETLIRDIDSQKGLYAEAVLLGSRYQGLFRVIPPRYLLALLMTEKSEKAQRHLLEKEHDVLEAAEIMAKKLEQPKTAIHNRTYFYD
ncbi:TPA: conjugative transfer ATPase [Legionella pneumophila]|uniref:Type IV secretory protein VirB4 component n=3 Tax=Legionella TaxID=445 RepID=A0A0W0XQM0_9GAMM|nr:MULTISPECIES: conjugative transfer ATPase [Legionella]AMQ28933.1 type IV secretory protein VirB4 [Legionella pneumophila subsp. pneumophila]AMV15574.1 F pilus assembly Type-IV secretion system for plasmid transfer [Legionella pneumophila]ETO94091.1 conjugative transfer ATPase, PFL_4706 family [Legionella oakridgensis RV-2-2007]KTD07305.1 Type IV secretory protein VirB4 component [Legionella jamestowniensis]KTD46894.1 Type IV secretory protein VirB4 component [Legionella rubrilucens]